MLYRSLIGATALVATWMTGSAPAQDMSKLPDWSGQWKNTSGIQWDQTKPLGRAQQAPLTPEYQARYEANLADQAAGGLGDAGGQLRQVEDRAAGEGQIVDELLRQQIPAPAERPVLGPYDVFLFGIIQKVWSLADAAKP